MAGNSRQYWCSHCKQDRTLVAYSGDISAEAREHVFECSVCGCIVDIDDPRTRRPLSLKQAAEYILLTVESAAELTYKVPDKDARARLRMQIINNLESLVSNR